ncbi:MAG: helix-hairpin-helix domain-containing protein [Chloroflexota bacterium]|nr:helix-hairpin-helix domain-containing protein [Chloroflexota bacterium]
MDPEESGWASRVPRAAFLSALLIALALMSLVILARPRSEAPSAQALKPTTVPTSRLPEPTVMPTSRPTQPPPTATLVRPTATPTPAPVTVYVAGEVRWPGMYTLAAGSRIGDAVKRAGGMTRRADPVAINLALRLRDEMQVTVPARAGRSAVKSPPPIVEPTRMLATPIPTPAEPQPTEAPSERAEPQPTDEDATAREEHEAPAVSGPININTATQAELESLPGIGPSKARAIIEHRTQKGPFRKPEDLQDVTGIGPKTWEQLKDKVTV